MAAKDLTHVMALEICEDEPWSPVTEFVLNCEPTWSHLLSYHSAEILQGQCHMMISPQQCKILLNSWTFTLGRNFEKRWKDSDP